MSGRAQRRVLVACSEVGGARRSQTRGHTHTGGKVDGRGGGGDYRHQQIRIGRSHRVMSLTLQITNNITKSHDTMPKSNDLVVCSHESSASVLADVEAQWGPEEFVMPHPH